MPCFALIFQFSNRKMNKTGKKQFIGALWHWDSILYTQDALAQYLF